MYVLFSEANAEKELDPDELINELLDYLNKYWLQIIEICTSEQIVEILRLCEHKVRKYLISLAQSDSKISPETLDKVKKAAVAFKESSKSNEKEDIFEKQGKEKEDIP